MGWIPGVGPIPRFLKLVRNEGTAFALQTTIPSVARMTARIMAVPFPLRDEKLVSSISTFVLHTMTLK